MGCGGTPGKPRSAEVEHDTGWGTGFTRRACRGCGDCALGLPHEDGEPAFHRETIARLRLQVAALPKERDDALSALERVRGVLKRVLNYKRGGYVVPGGVAGSGDIKWALPASLRAEAEKESAL